MSADWRAIHALLSEHFEASLGRATTGFQVEPQEPVVVVYNVAESEQLRPAAETELRGWMLSQCQRVLTEAGYETLWGHSVRNADRALMVLEKTA